MTKKVIIAIAVLIAVYVAWKYYWLRPTPQSTEMMQSDEEPKRQMGGKHEKDVVVILYFANWCPHCIKFKPVWQFLASKMQDEKLSFKAVDCSNIDSEVKTPAGRVVNGFPTIVLNKEGYEDEYAGDRSTEDVLKWIQSNRQ